VAVAYRLHFFLLPFTRETKRVANQEERDERKSSQSAQQGSDSQSGDPGRTPDKAEGDEETVDEDLRQKEEQGEI
jgi:hypothetical protein